MIFCQSPSLSLLHSLLPANHQQGKAPTAQNSLPASDGETKKSESYVSDMYMMYMYKLLYITLYVPALLVL